MWKARADLTPDIWFQTLFGGRRSVSSFATRVMIGDAYQFT